MRDRLHDQERVAAEVEEVVGDADALDAEELAPDRRDSLLGVASAGPTSAGGGS